MLERCSKIAAIVTVLIIDAKYYLHTMQQQFDERTVHPNNLYQIFAYVKNKEAELANVSHEMSRMLLYARTDEEIQPAGVRSMRLVFRQPDLTATWEIAVN